MTYGRAKKRTHDASLCICLLRILTARRITAEIGRVSSHDWLVINRIFVTHILGVLTFNGIAHESIPRPQALIMPNRHQRSHELATGLKIRETEPDSGVGKVRAGTPLGTCSMAMAGGSPLILRLVEHNGPP